ncbi:beta-propeller domain-containing protein [Anabaena subtropica]|uniref:WD40 repeat domain-containing protein n=1 Tax=Anabaena subtropica FACHB-260 TaxID=2692884 RepID=A0ABR8CRT3_9NOST|nr:WD40 repeat domain-containing protein [Anabaena subtropica]MBD2345664.1 WD40 repeat domain-containing protein [Anabaena subtropica FACHB-260]
MTSPNDPLAIIDSILAGNFTTADLASLRQSLTPSSSQNVVQLGKYNVNIGQGQGDIHIGDKIYQGTDADTIKTIIQAVLEEFALPRRGADKSLQKWKYLHTFKGHLGAINALAISLNGQTLVSGSNDKTLKLWDLRTLQLLYSSPPSQSAITSLAISTDGKTIIAGSQGGTLRTWNLPTRELAGNPTKLHKGAINCVAINPNCQTVVTCGSDRTLKVIDLFTKNIIHNLSAGKTPIKAISISPDKQTLVTASEAGTIKTWNLTTGKLIYSLAQAHESSINTVTFIANSLTFITGSSNKTIKIWTINSAKKIELLHTLDRGKTPVKCLVIYPDGRTLISGSEGGVIKFWDLETQELLHTLLEVHLSSINCLAISSDSQNFVTGSEGGNIKVWRRYS